MNGRRKNLRARTKIYLIAIAVITLVATAAIILSAMSYSSTDVLATDNDETYSKSEVSFMNDDIEDTGKIYDNVFIDEIDVGGLTKSEAAIKIEEELLVRLKNKKINLTHKDSNWELNYKEIVTYDTKEAIEKAYSIGRDGSSKERKDKIKSLANTPEKLNMTATINDTTIDSKLEEIAPEVLVKAVNASATRENGKFVTSPGTVGQELDINETKTKILDLANNAEEGVVDLVMKETKPLFNEDSFNSMTDVLGSFTTNYNVGAGDRNINLKTAASKINNTCLFPGDVFSTNKALGPSTYENGYVDAPVIVGGKLEDGIGGGVCQVSSTLYNAVLFSELEIVERQNHSLPVAYVPLGRDATLAGDYIDFKFKNSTNNPIYVESYLEGGKVFVKIYGHEERSPNRKLEFESVTETLAPAGETVIEDPSLPEGTRKVITAAKSGQRAVVYKKIIVDGVVQDKVKINTSTYKATRGEVRVGTGPKTPAEGEDTETTDAPPTTLTEDEDTPIILSNDTPATNDTLQPDAPNIETPVENIEQQIETPQNIEQQPQMPPVENNIILDPTIDFDDDIIFID